MVITILGLYFGLMSLGWQYYKYIYKLTDKELL